MRTEKRWQKTKSCGACKLITGNQLGMYDHGTDCSKVFSLCGNAFTAAQKLFARCVAVAVRKNLTAVFYGKGQRIKNLCVRMSRIAAIFTASAVYSFLWR